MPCSIKGRYADPRICLKVLSHPLRRKILHKLAIQTIDGPVNKKELAKAVGIGYQELLYQLNNHLKSFWEVKQEQKKRGAHEEFIAPPDPNTVYIMIGEGATIYVIDPLANIFGKLSDGTRCDHCPTEQVEKCLEKIKTEKYFGLSLEERRKQEKLLAANNRPNSPNPMDFIASYIALKSLEGEMCTVQICETECHFIKAVRLNIQK